MVIGTAAAILGGLAVAGGAASAITSSNAANRATDASRDATAANNALARDIYSQNSATLAPFVQQGGAATAYINQLLGIQTPATTAPAAPAQPAGGFMGTTNSGLGGTTYGGMLRDDFRVSDGLNGILGRVALSGLQRNGWQPTTAAAPGGTVQAAPQLAPGAAGNAFDAYRNSTGYNFRRDEGMRAVTSNRALSGLLNSGSAVKSAMRFGDGIAAAEFDNYFNRLAGQQGVGLSAASAQAGVANNYSSQVQQNNAVNASNIGNAQIARANNTSNFLGGLLNAGAYAFGARG